MLFSLLMSVSASNITRQSLRYGWHAIVWLNMLRCRRHYFACDTEETFSKILIKCSRKSWGNVSYIQDACFLAFQQWSVMSSKGVKWIYHLTCIWTSPDVDVNVGGIVLPQYFSKLPKASLIITQSMLQSPDLSHSTSNLSKSSRMVWNKIIKQ